MSKEKQNFYRVHMVAENASSGGFIERIFGHDFEEAALSLINVSAEHNYSEGVQEGFDFLESLKRLKPYKDFLIATAVQMEQIGSRRRTLKKLTDLAIELKSDSMSETSSSTIPS